MHICFILVEPCVPENIGAAARAIKTMGFSCLKLVNPHDYMNKRVRTLAHGSVDILNNALIFNSLEEAIEGIDFTIGTTAKKRSAKYDYYDCNEIPQIIDRKGSTIRSAGIVFGREESGLTNQELKLCDLATRIPLKKDFPSLNLSQAVMIYAYTLSGFSLPGKAEKYRAAEKEGLKELKTKVETILKDLHIDRNMNLYHRIIERMMVLKEEDIHLLNSISNRYLERK